jgi:hypothetical protein
MRLRPCDRDAHKGRELQGGVRYERRKQDHTSLVPRKIWVVIAPGSAPCLGGLLLLIGLIGVRRLYLNAHWLSDVVGGYVLGGVYCALAAAVLEGIERKVVAPYVQTGPGKEAASERASLSPPHCFLAPLLFRGSAPFCSLSLFPGEKSGWEGKKSAVSRSYQRVINNNGTFMPVDYQECRAEETG